ncbi:hypothetical protein [Corallococcus carmarthensis]|uniref:Lipoprotein n=1 Tax=Corallococcus carmarthensis TaxID=2316728 RepID=A0A3A8K6R5_9BACT|nr:hypothetical protein [Corallococcus carmarthensis]NOK17357.1 hypothetical protein [Corallococcus carmarthensis]RKH03206.1 hypothetical protein D7X32_14740 [Corallococcus carmarthensis]
MKRSLRGAWLALGLGLLGAWACATGSAPADAPGAEEKAMASAARASVDVFSGREAPTWALSDDESRALREAVEALPEGTRPLPDVGLGYRGFTVTWADGARATVHGAVVEFVSGGRTQLREDAPRAVEERLLLGSRAHLDPELFKAVASQVQAAQP